MIDNMISKEQSEYFKKIGFEFSDKQKVALIWHAPAYPWEKKLSLLKEFSENTNDDILKRQILERIDYENKSMAIFKKNPEKKHVYIIRSHYKNNHTVDEGFFYDFYQAYDACMELINTYLRFEDDICSVGITKEEIRLGKYTSLSGGAGLSLNMDGEAKFLISFECESKCDIEEDRFECEMINFPLAPDFQIGIIVQDINTKEIFLFGELYENWSTHTRVTISTGNELSGARERAVLVYSLNKRAYWIREHMNPLYLTTEIDWLGVDDEYKKIAELMSIWLKGDKSVDRQLLELMRKHAGKNYKNKIYSASSVSDMLS